MSIGLGLVFLAGLVSFLSPCVISLAPAYLGAIGSFEVINEKKGNQRANAMISGCFFVLGFSLIFVLLGFSATLLGNLLYQIKPWLARIGGLLIVIFGLHITGLINIPLLNYEFRPRKTNRIAGGLMGAFLMGIFFSAGWSPCIGPILGSILTTLAASQVSLWHGILYLSAYSLGMAIPFLMMSAGIQPIFQAIKAHKKVLHVIQIVSGILLSITGVLLMFGVFSRLAQISIKWLV